MLDNCTIGIRTDDAATPSKIDDHRSADKRNLLAIGFAPNSGDKPLHPRIVHEILSMSLEILVLARHQLKQNRNLSQRDKHMGFFS